MKTYITIACAAIILSGCSRTEPTSQTSEPKVVANMRSTCPDDGPRLAETGICAGRAVHYMNIVGGVTPDLPKNCTWEVNETAMAGGDYLLYLAAMCKGKKAQLEFSGGATFAYLSLVWSAVANRALTDASLIKVTGADMVNPHDNILYHAKKAMNDEAEAAKCSVRPAVVEGWPEDALVVDVSSDEAMKAPTGMPRIACGAFGLDQDNTSYWRVFQGFSWWFQFSQDAHQDIDPRSLTLVTPNGNGGWNTLE